MPRSIEESQECIPETLQLEGRLGVPGKLSKLLVYGFANVIDRESIKLSDLPYGATVALANP